jgi:gliding motility-associated lipoprotein GldH
VNIDLFEPKTGKPLGSGLGDIFDHRQLLLDDYKFPNSGKYTISFQQYMRVDSLTNIRSMGVRIEKSVSQ